MRANRMRIAVVSSGPTCATTDVEAGLVYGLTAHGIDVVRWAIEDVLPERLDVVILVTAIRHEFTRIVKHEPRPAVTALFTESPYESEKELAVAAGVDGCWTHERTAVSAFRAVNPDVAYLPHAWHPGIHTREPQPGDDEIPAHDVVFVGSGFRERVAFFNAIDWTGIDLGLYGIWDGLGLNDQVAACVRSPGPIANTQAAALYRRARIGLNLYRRLGNLGPDVPANWVTAESLNPRAYELAACDCFQISEYRAEIGDVFGDRVPTFMTPGEASTLIRTGLAEGKLHAAPPTYTSWLARAHQVLQDLHTWGLT